MDKQTQTASWTDGQGDRQLHGLMDKQTQTAAWTDEQADTDSFMD